MQSKTNSLAITTTFKNGIYVTGCFCKKSNALQKQPIESLAQ
jgi:hypothetical protein